MPLNRVATVLIACALSAGCGGGPKPMSLVVPLRVRVTEPLEATPLPGGSSSLKLHIAEVRDLRPEKTKIGENQEDEKLGARPITAGGAPPVRFVREIFSRELPRVGVATVQAASEANRILIFRLSQFYVVETGTYKAVVGGAVEITDGSGQSLFRTSLAGANGTFGRSFSAENYEQVLSNATVDLLATLLRDPAFRTALTVK